MLFGFGEGGFLQGIVVMIDDDWKVKKSQFFVWAGSLK